MSNPVIRTVVAVVIGTVIGMAFMMGLHMATSVVYPPPEGVDMMSQEPENMERMKEWFRTLPAGAFILAAVCHGLGSLCAAVIATFISGRQSLLPAIVVGVLFTLAGIMNLSSIPHPSWFPFVDVPLYLIMAVCAGLALRRRSES